MKPHAWKHDPVVSRRRCRYCGLLWLRNALSDAAARARCKWWDDE